MLRPSVHGRLLSSHTYANWAWIENRNVAIEYRWSEGRTERYAEIAAEFVRMKVDVIVTVGSAIPTVRQATSVIPIVFAAAGDPVGTGLPRWRGVGADASIVGIY